MIAVMPSLLATQVPLAGRPLGVGNGGPPMWASPPVVHMPGRKGKTEPPTEVEPSLVPGECQKYKGAGRGAFSRRRRLGSLQEVPLPTEILHEDMVLACAKCFISWWV